MSLPEPEPLRFPLKGKAQDVLLEREGVRHPWSGRGWGRVFTAYDDLTHVAASPRFVWIASRRGLTVLPRRLFEAEGDPDRLARALAQRVGARPGGAERLARMVEIDARGRRPYPPRVTRLLALLCVLLFGLQVFHWEVTAVGAFTPALFADGDWWRLLTANLLHSLLLPAHIVANLIGLLVVGRLVERALGPLRILCVMGVSGVTSMAASGLAVDGMVVGVSGILMGLVGSLLFLEVARSEDLPAWWRFPRPLLWVIVAGLAFEMVLGFTVTFIAGEAHLGGLIGGAVATALVTRGAGLRAPEATWVRHLAALTAAATVVALGAAGESWLGADDFTAEHAARLAGIPGIAPEELNNHAWLIAVDPGHTHEQLEAALALAERAVDETEAQEPTILDTLAEVQFQLGRADQAVLTIEQALEQAPTERDYRYYYEQRRRFTGERAADDRPADPNGLPAWKDESEERSPLPASGEGLSV